ncbi:MAG: hypothetical protein M1476_01360 [Candidatus Thermoplasmatota archaeon]|nr:hypothetical protein [Candidatus Thermoplasmatota archaeon]
MEFPTRIGKKYVIQIPKNIREFDELCEGDAVIVTLHRKDRIERAKLTLEKKWSNQ